MVAASGLLSGMVRWHPHASALIANHCVRLADLCDDDPQLRQHLLELASEWMAMAAQDKVDAGQ